MSQFSCLAKFASLKLYNSCNVEAVLPTERRLLRRLDPLQQCRAYYVHAREMNEFSKMIHSMPPPDQQYKNTLPKIENYIFR